MKTLLFGLLCTIILCHSCNHLPDNRKKIVFEIEIENMNNNKKVIELVFSREPEFYIVPTQGVPCLEYDINGFRCQVKCGVVDFKILSKKYK